MSSPPSESHGPETTTRTLTRQWSLPGTNGREGHRHRFGRSLLSKPLCSVATEAPATSQRRVRVTRPFGRVYG
ncbi:hypothetical protein E2562_005717 [Oryza meyeriana var. granulata]|uniref:Uncharacterized protein n=1 Tax=Oryza meyeriana var. granulata TaxID=110450 RepID=A0A6G1F488_9ORYZ|nr:hypothetical protein E2562_005717 [Oryza meyeriana var. granulata]